MDIATSFRSWIAAAAARDKANLQLLLAPTVTYNNTTLHPFEDLDAFVASTVSSEIEATEIDILVVDDSQSKVAARLIHTGKKNEQGVAPEWSKHVMVWFEAGKVVKVWSQADTTLLQEIRSGKQTSPVPRSPPTTTSSNTLSHTSLSTSYKAYIHAINTHTMHADFPSFVHPNVTHNTVPLSLTQYADFIETSFQEIQGLHFHLKEIVCDSSDQTIGTWIEFTGTPLTAFRGIEPTGRGVRFTELVIYKLREGKIELVWSLLDLDAYRKCLSGEIDPGT